MFRVRHRRYLPFAAAFAGVGGALVAGLGLDSMTGLSLVLGSGAAGVFLGRRSIYYECSDPNCAKRLKRADDTCERCGGVVHGTIASDAERLDALEALEDGTFVSLD